jgi:hypothetical protein
MTLVCKFIGMLSITGKKFQRIQRNCKKYVWRQGLEEDTCTKKNVKEGKPAADQRDFSTMRYVRNLAFIANIAAEVESDRHVTVRKLATVHGMSTDHSRQAA